MQRHIIIRILMLSVVTCLLAACSTSVSYKPPLLPVRFVLDDAGNISVVGEVSLVTFIGEFSIGAEYTINSEPDSILVIVRDQKKSSHGLDTIYRVRTNGDEFTVVLNGETTIQVANKQVIIDVTNADIKSIAFERAENSGVSSSSGFWKTSEDSYRPFKVMQRLIDKDTWLSKIVALPLFFVELLAVPFCFILRGSEILFGDIGRYGAYGVYAIVMVISGLTANDSEGSAVLAVITIPIFVCGAIILLLL